jgi:hypothetical protein
MSSAQLTIVITDQAVPAVERFRLDDKTRQLGKLGLANARAILAEAAARREASTDLQAQAA